MYKIIPLLFGRRNRRLYQEYTPFKLTEEFFFGGGGLPQFLILPIILEEYYVNVQTGQKNVYLKLQFNYF